VDAFLTVLMRAGEALERWADCCSAMTDRRNSRHENEERHKGQDQEKREAFAAASLAGSGPR